MPKPNGLDLYPCYIKLDYMVCALAECWPLNPSPCIEVERGSRLGMETGGHRKAMGDTKNPIE